MPVTNEDILFLKQKIEEIRIALFKAETDSILQLPNNIISTLKADENGYIWFYTSYTGPYVQCLEKELYISLEYYRKDINCRLLINGKASIDEGSKDFISSYSNKKTSTDKTVLLKVKISQAEYFENKPLAKISFKEKIKSAVNYIMAANPRKMYDFSS